MPDSDRPPPPAGRTTGAPAIAARLARLRQGTVRGGLLDVQESAALAAVGFEPVSEVIGAVADSVRPGGFYASGAVWGSGPNPSNVRTYTSSSGTVAVGTPPTIIALRAGYRRALTRLTAEAVAVGGDGVVGLRITRTVEHYSGIELWRFLAVGTAIRSLGRTHTTTPFTTTLPAAQVAAAIRAGWIPVSALVVPVMAVRYVDQPSRRRRSRFADNGEIDAYTDVVNTCRRQARSDFAAAARAVRADGAVMSEMTLSLESGPSDSVCYAAVTITGTALAGFAVRGMRSDVLTVSTDTASMRTIR